MNEIAKTGKDPTSPILAQIRRLHAFRREILQLPPEKAIGLILSAEKPLALVHSFPEEDLYCLIHDIGPEDALPLIRLASSNQLEFILDQELWEEERFSISSATRWMDLLLQADGDRLIRWLSDNQLPTLELYLFRTLEVKLREHDQDPSEFEKGFSSLDNTLYFRIIDPPTPVKPAAEYAKRHQEVVSRLLKQMADMDYYRFQSVLLESGVLIPAEAEEEIYRLRSTRLGEKGFLPFDEAVGIYQAVNLEAFEHLAVRRERPEADAAARDRVPISSNALVEPGSLFTDALRSVDADEWLEELQGEFAALCNRLAVADRKRVQGRPDLAPVVRKACGYLSIGLEVLNAHRGSSRSSPADGAVRWLSKYLLSEIFRLGYSEVMRVKWSADRWVADSWFARQGLPLTFWGERWTGVLGGLLLKRPRYYDNYRTGVLYREFECLEEVRECAAALERIQAMDRLLSRLKFERINRPVKRLLSWENLLLTLWARHEIGLSNTIEPIPLESFRPFFSRLSPESFPTEDGDSPSASEMKSEMLRWLVGWSGMDAVEIGETVGESLEALFSELESEYSNVRSKDLDPRFVMLFLLQR